MLYNTSQQSLGLHSTPLKRRHIQPVENLKGLLTMDLNLQQSKITIQLNFKHLDYAYRF